VSASNQKTGKENIKNFNSVVINNGIDLAAFNNQNHFKNVREELGILPNDCVIGFAGRITAQKEPITLIKAFKKYWSSTKAATLFY